MRGVALVMGGGGKFRVCLTEAEPPRAYEGPHRYASPDMAFAAADALTRHRLGSHKCGEECTGWVQIADGNVVASAETLNHHRLAS